MSVEATKQTPVVQTNPATAQAAAAAKKPEVKGEGVKAQDSPTPAPATEAKKENLPPEQGKKLDVVA